MVLPDLLLFNGSEAIVVLLIADQPYKDLISDLSQNDGSVKLLLVLQAIQGITSHEIFSGRENRPLTVSIKKWATIGPPAIRHSNGVSLVG